MDYKEHLAQVYAASDSGLDIIKSVCPQAADAGNKNFKLRLEERTESAHLYPPDSRCSYWRVVDYGGGEGEQRFSPIDLYMRERGYHPKSDFSLALHELMEQYGVAEALSSRVNKPEIERRPATPDEVGQPPHVALREGFTAEELAVWGPRVKAEHLEALGWQAVASVARTKDGETIITKATPTFPMFAQACTYLNDSGTPGQFLKLYEPKNPNKAFRFSIVGRKPQHYLFGLDALRREFKARGEEKLDEVVLVSGGSDAVNALSMGWQPVWMGSETEALTEDDFFLLLGYARRIVNIPDIDATGQKQGRLLALRLPGIFTAWMTPQDMGYLHDNRGRQRKDLKDFIQLHPDKKSMRQLIDRALPAQFYRELTTKDGQKEYLLSLTSLNYFLELNGFCTLKDESRREPVFIHIDGIVVRQVTAKAIVGFLRQWMQQQGLPQALRDKVLRSRDLPTSTASTLRERDDLDFRKGTPTAQYFHFRNCWVEVTGEGITTHRYADAADHCVWEENIIPHDFKAVPEMFQVSTDADGRFEVHFPEGVEQSLLFQFVVNSSRLHWRKADEFGQPLTEEETAEEHLCLASRLANMGYMLTSHKSESEAWATICLDSTMAESVDECNGRSGKSFYYRAVAKMTKTFVIDAGNTSFRDPRFIFDGVTADTDLVLIDECPRKFNYNFIYGLVTGDFRVEEKNRHSFVIPFDRSPKFGLGTNFTLSRHDPSTEGRIWPQPFSDYYHVKTPQNDYRETRSIRDDFGQNLMGADYSEHDWQLDLAFMVQCVRFYLSRPQGSRRIMPPMNRIERREQMAAVGKDFKQWADEFFAEDSGHLDCELKAETVLSDFNRETRFDWPPKRMTQHLRDYCQFAEHLQALNPTAITHKEKDGERWLKRDENGQQKAYYYVQSARAAADTAKAAPAQPHLAFSEDTAEEPQEGMPF